MDTLDNPAAKKTAELGPLHCLNPECRGLLAYEVDEHNVLHVDLAWMAERDGDLRFFPCPKCGGRNIVEPCTRENGKPGHRVTRFAPAGA